MRSMLTIFCCILLIMLFHTVGSAETVATSGFGLFKHSREGWNWDAVTSARFTTALEQRDGSYVLKFTIIGDLSDIDYSKARVGIVSGNPGTQPSIWFSAEKPYKLDASVQSPWATNLVAQAVLQSATMTKSADGFIIELALDSAPVFRSAWDMYLIIDADGNTTNGFLGTEYLIQNTKLTGEDVSDISVAWFDSRPGVLKTGQKGLLTAVIQNNTTSDLAGVRVKLVIPAGLKLLSKYPEQLKLRAKETKRIECYVTAEEPGYYPVRVQISTDKSQTSGSQMVHVTSKRDPRHEFQMANGGWAQYPERPTMQKGNHNKVELIKSLPSAKLKRNLFGITAHIPRSVNEENPYAVSHLTDGDLTSCWASRWWRVSVPYQPEWVQIDLKRQILASEIRFLPAWKNSGMPAALKIEGSVDGRKWEPLYDNLDYQPQTSGDTAKRHRELSWQIFPLQNQSFRYVRFEASRLTQGGTSFFCAPMEPFQFRIAEIQIVDSTGAVVDTAKAIALCSSVHTAWYNSPETIKKTWPLMLKSGVKINRIGQWGDKTDWATVEKTKGVYKVDAELDRHITESVNKGIDIMMTLDYGNNLYQQLPDAPEFGPIWQRGHPFLQCAPTTPEAVEAFAKYCAFMATHFKGRVNCFEIWNEENGWFFDAWSKNGSVEMVKAYGKALTAAAKAIKQANPDAKVCFGGTAGSAPDFWRIALDEGAGPYLDLVAFHPYGHGTPEGAPSHFLTAVDGKMDWKPRPAEITDYEIEINAFRSLVRKYNPSLDVWANEMNWFAPGEPANPGMGDMSELSQAKHLARFYATNAWLGCGAVWWSLYNANGVQEWAVLRSADMSPRAAYYSAGYVSTVLDAVTAADDIRPEVIGRVPDDLVVKAYRNDAGELIVGLWLKSSANDGCQPVEVSLRVPSLQAAKIELLDSLYGYRQMAKFENAGGSVTLDRLLVGDWPLFVRIAK